MCPVTVIPTHTRPSTTHLFDKTQYLYANKNRGETADSHHKFIDCHVAEIFFKNHKICFTNGDGGDTLSRPRRSRLSSHSYRRRQQRVSIKVGLWVHAVCQISVLKIFILIRPLYRSAKPPTHNNGQEGTVSLPYPIPYLSGNLGHLWVHLSPCLVLSMLWSNNDHIHVPLTPTRTVEEFSPGAPHRTLGPRHRGHHRGTTAAQLTHSIYTINTLMHGPNVRVR